MTTTKKFDTLLVIDDDDAILRMMKMRLESDGYSVITASKAETALVAVSNAPVFAVLLDLHLGDVSGFEIMARIKKARPELRIIMVTGSHDESEARKAFDLGAWDYITKPIDFDYLNNVLRMPG